MRPFWASLFLALFALTSHAADPDSAPVSGSAFNSPELKALQADEFANPASLWVEEGQSLWHQAEGDANKSCAQCHGNAAESMKGVAARYPVVDKPSGALLNLELRINVCRERHMRAPPLKYVSSQLLGLTAYIAAQSKGIPMAVETGGPAAAYLEKGRAFFHQRQGQLNLSCANCHVRHSGQRLRGDTISHGVGVGYPVYRLEWQSMGSLHRRLRACSLGVRAVQFDYGSSEYLSLELYLAARSAGLPLDAPSIRK